MAKETRRAIILGEERPCPRPTWHEEDIQHVAWAVVGLTDLIEFIDVVLHGPHCDGTVDPVVQLEITLQPGLQIGCIGKEGVEGVQVEGGVGDDRSNRGPAPQRRP